MPAPMNVRELLEQRRAANKDKTFLFSEIDDREWTYSQFDATVNRTANMLRSHGIEKGDVVSLLLPNSAEYVIAYFACWKIGALAGPVNSLLKSEEIEWVVGNSEAKLMLVGSDFSETVAAMAKSEPPAVAGGSTRAHEVSSNAVQPAATAGVSDLSSPPDRDARSGVKIIEFSNVSIADEFADELGPVDLNTDDEAIIIYTSGTTGKPKGCLLTHGNLIANAKQITEWMGFREDDRLLTLMPLFHMNAVSVTTMTALYAGASTVVSPKFSASRFWEVIEKYQITSFGSVATMLSMLLAKSDAAPSAPSSVGRGLSGIARDSEHMGDAYIQPPATAGGSDLDERQARIQSPATEGGSDSSPRNPKSQIPNPKSRSLRFAMCGSAPVPAEVLRKFEETFGVLVIEGYGLSESTCRSTFNPPNEDRRPGSCGKPIGNEMKVFDENDKEVADNELGEIVVRGPNIFKGYFKNPSATEKAFANGWFHTGDIGYRDTDGFFYIADRKSDMIIRGGENIYPREIDDLLYTHPAVSHAAVIGVPDDLYGEEVAAFVVLKDGYEVSSDDLIAFCREHLADYKCPKTIQFVDDIPKGPTGKLLKRELAARLHNVRTP